MGNFLASWPAKIAIFAILLALRVSLWLWESKVASAKGHRESWIAGTRETLDALMLTIGLVFFLVQPFVLQPFYVPSGSMEDTLLYRPTNDRLLVSKWTYRLREPMSGDVVVFRPPAAANPENPNDDLIKRCIGVPGDVVYADGNRALYRNGQKMNEPYAKWSVINEMGMRLSFSYDMKVVGGRVYSREYSAPGAYSLWRTGGEFVPEEDQQTISDARPEAIPPGMYLMLGDHRNNSSDGHVWGFVPRENIVGKAMCVFWPPSRVGTFDRKSAQQITTTNRVPVGTP
jgi:signal peptidase I